MYNIEMNSQEVLDRVGRFTDAGKGEDPTLATSGHEFETFGRLWCDQKDMTVEFQAVDMDTDMEYRYTVRVDRMPESYAAMFDGSVSWLAIDAEADNGNN